MPLLNGELSTGARLRPKHDAEMAREIEDVRRKLAASEALVAELRTKLLKEQLRACGLEQMVDENRRRLGKTTRITGIWP